MNRNYKKISELIDEISMGPFGSDIKVDYFVKQGVPVLNGSNIASVKLRDGFTNFVSHDRAKGYKKAVANRGDIVITHRGTLGQIAYIPDDSEFEEYVISQSQFRVRLKPELINPVYFAYYFHTKEGQKRLLSFKSHVGVPALAQATTNFRLLDFPLRPKGEQDAIAAVLESIDRKVELNNRINSELEVMAKTLYDYWFVQFDFPDANGKPYKASGGKMVYSSVLKRDIPKGWHDGCASNIFIFNPTTNLSKGSVAKYIDMDSLPIKGFMTKRPEEKEFAGGTKFIKNDVAVARITPCLENGKTALLSRLEEGETGFGSTEFIILRGRNFPLFGFASCLSRSESFRQFAIANMSGTSGRKRVDAKVLETYSLAIPPGEILEKFEKNVSLLFEKMTANSVENDELSDLRDWLLPMLMNGQVTVKPSNESQEAQHG